MADYKNRYSFEIPIRTESEGRWLLDRIEALEEKEGPFGEVSVETGEAAPLVLWFRCLDDYAHIEGLADQIQKFLQEFHRSDAVAFQWANICSFDGFGGGALLITASEKRWFDVGDWLREQRRAFEAARPAEVMEA